MITHFYKDILTTNLWVFTPKLNSRMCRSSRTSKEIANYTLFVINKTHDIFNKVNGFWVFSVCP